MTNAVKTRTPRQAKVSVRGFLRGQIVDGETGKIVGDSGWVENTLTNIGLKALCCFAAQVAGSSQFNYAIMATQNTAMNMTQTAMVGTTNSYRSLTLATSTSGTPFTTQATVSFSSTDLSASCSVAGAGLMQTNAAGGLWAGQTFASSVWNTNQNFNLTYEIRFNTA